MKKVMQTKTGLGGNCEGATLATLLGLDISDVPDFHDGCDDKNPSSEENGEIYQTNLNNFLAKFNLKSVSIGWNSPNEDSSAWVENFSSQLGVPHLVAGKSPRGYMHSVIYKGGKLWHDPHPEGGGVIPCQIQFLMPIIGGEND